MDLDQQSLKRPAFRAMMPLMTKMNKPKILVVDDEPDILELVRLNLAREGYEVLGATTGEQGLDLARSKQPSLIVLDLMLPGIDGLEVCKRLRADPKTQGIPILMLTAKGEESDVVSGLEVGADDYVTKPFSGKILVARVRNLLRRVVTKEEGHMPLKVHEITIDPDRREVRIKDRPVALTFTEFNILLTLARQPGRVFSRYQIVDSIHGDDYLVTDRAVDVQIVSLRKKLGTCGAYIETVRGVGYKFKD
jgi:two-component system, OmpR family, alkaline phosphatase synthesis response regulator PhoP